MDHSIETGSDSARRFWGRYINILEEQGVNLKVRRWYVKRIEQYITHYEGQRLRTHTSQHIVDFLTQLGREGQLSDWQFRQTVDAIRILFCSFLRLSPCSLVDWDYWMEASMRLTPRHATLAREAVADPSDEQLPRNFTIQEVRGRFADALSRLIAEIRARAYSIRTEQSYEQWVVRFLASQPHSSLDELSADDVRRFLDHLSRQGQTTV